MVVQLCHSLQWQNWLLRQSPESLKYLPFCPLWKKFTDHWDRTLLSSQEVHSGLFPVVSYPPGDCYALLFFTSNQISLILESHSIWSAKPLSLCMLLRSLIHVTVCISASFALLNGVSLYGCMTVCLCIALLIDIWVVSSFWLLQLKRLGIF